MLTLLIELQSPGACRIAISTRKELPCHIAGWKYSKTCYRIAKLTKDVVDDSGCPVISFYLGERHRKELKFSVLNAPKAFLLVHAHRLLSSPLQRGSPSVTLPALRMQCAIGINLFIASPEP